MDSDEAPAAADPSAAQVVACPSCARPTARARVACLYCGSSLPKTLEKEVRILEAPSQPPSARALVVVAPARCDAGDLARALNLGDYEARLWLRQPTPRAWRWLARSPAEAEASRLRAAGLDAEVLDGIALHRSERPVQALRGGELPGGGVALQLAEGSVSLTGADIALAVMGPIAREVQLDPAAPERAGYRALRRTTPRLEPGFRFHLHPARHEFPIEIDPEAFEFAVRECGLAPRLSVQRWIERMACPQDDNFKHLTPAIAPRAQPQDGLLQALRGPSKPGRLELDNLAQFRSYSAWRALFERQRRH